MLDVSFVKHPIDPAAFDTLVDALDERHGVVLASGVDYPGRYTRWDLGFVDPPLMLEARGWELDLTVLNERGRIPLRAFVDALTGIEGVSCEVHPDGAHLVVEPQWDDVLPEELRTRRRSSFTVLRALLAVLPKNVPHLGLYGAFGYDLIRQIERLPGSAPEGQRDLCLYLPDSFIAVDRQRGDANEYEFEFSYGGESTASLPRTHTLSPFEEHRGTYQRRDHGPGEFAQLVDIAKASFARGDLFEVDPGQAFRRELKQPPSRVFRYLRVSNPAPYGAFMNLGRNEFLVVASPEMYVRVADGQVETAPISGTIRRGADALEDADRILELLSSDKDRAELSMCTDVDRNDKSRVCVPGTVHIIGRRQIELYSKLIHTVDHVIGELRPEFDGLDAFASHMWAVTVTGAPKLWAMRFIDEHERSPRTWYSGALGAIFPDGTVNTGLTIRAAMIRDGVAEVRAGATLLIDSDPESEERETETKVSAMLQAIDHVNEGREAEAVEPRSAARSTGTGHRVLLLDHEDSFVQTLAGYLAETGATVETLRVPLGGIDPALLAETLERVRPTLAVMSPGPGNPSQFNTSQTIAQLIERGIAIFGVCLGHQAIGEYFGGTLRQLDYPLHGQERSIVLRDPGFLRGMPGEFVTGRYHSLYVDAEGWPEELRLVADDADGVPMALQHRELPIFAVQFHPESLMTLKGGSGRTIIDAVLEHSPR